MANLLNFKLPKRIAVLYNDLYWLPVKLHKSSSSFGFIKKCLYLNVITKFSTLRGQFLSKNERHAAEQNLFVSHSTKHINDLKQLLLKHCKITDELKSSIDLLLFNMSNSNILRTSRAMRISSFKTKNKKLIALSNTTKNKINAYDVPVINLSSIQLSDKELNQLSFGLDHSYVDKNKHVKKNLPANFESLAQAVNSEILNEEKEDFHEFLRAYCDIFTKNVYSTKDYTYSNLKRLIKDDTLVVIPGDKDSCVIIMDKVDYVTKMEETINNGIQKGVYAETEDNTLRDLKRFQDFLY